MIVSPSGYTLPSSPMCMGGLQRAVRVRRNQRTGARAHEVEEEGGLDPAQEDVRVGTAPSKRIPQQHAHVSVRADCELLLPNHLEHAAATEAQSADEIDDSEDGTAEVVVHFEAAADGPVVSAEILRRDSFEDGGQR